MKIQIKSVFGSLLFEHESKDNTIKKTIEEAIKQGANLRYADLSYADLYSANLRYADLSYADLYSANLRYADLSSADLYSANLRYADLRYADLRYADLSSANLRYADLRYAKNIETVGAHTRIIPEEGSFVGWKKCRDNKLVKVLIPEEAKRSNSTGRKCRAEFVDVLDIIDLNDKRKKPTLAISQHDSSVEYVVGKRVVCDQWDENPWNECGGGIHFFIGRYEAERY